MSRPAQLKIIWMLGKVEKRPNYRKIFILEPKYGLIDSKIVGRYKKWSQSSKSNFKQVCIDPYVQNIIIIQ